MFVLIGLAMLVNGIGGTPAMQNAPYTTECQAWADSMQAGTDAPVMHYVGCDDASGTYERLDGYCNQAARRAYREGLSGEAFNVYVGNSGAGCVLADDGSWLPE